MPKILRFLSSLATKEVLGFFPQAFRHRCVARSIVDMQVRDLFYYFIAGDVPYDYD
ncbi:hypothetical protein [Microcoleus asticus]|uniref:hypothetical protein n=1 Tax=Microcoleus asticus TaxID=2815231 RepID=UPI0015550B89|nr:hypothetical protein [Microcoleus asticus]